MEAIVGYTNHAHWYFCMKCNRTLLIWEDESVARKGGTLPLFVNCPDCDSVMTKLSTELHCDAILPIFSDCAYFDLEHTGESVVLTIPKEVTGKRTMTERLYREAINTLWGSGLPDPRSLPCFGCCENCERGCHDVD